MIARKIINRSIDLESLLKDVNTGAITGLHYHKKGDFDPEHEVIEMVVGRGINHTYAVQLSLEHNQIKCVQRVKFEWMCGGWRSNDTIIKIFPVFLNQCETVLDEILERYLQPQGIKHK